MKTTSADLKYVSFVIIGKNAESSIARLLESILKLTPAHVASEIIYVDSASRDRTVDIVKQYPATILQLSASQPLCASAGRFMGLQYATGRYIAFIDSDMEVQEGWLDQAFAVLDDNPEIAVVSGIQLDVGAVPQETKKKSHDGESRTQAQFRDIGYGGNAAIFRHEVLDRVGTWNPYIISDEEPELCLRIRRAGYRVVQLNRPSVRHYGYLRPTLSALLNRRRRRLFVGYGQVIRYHLFTRFLWAYLRERGWVIVPAVVCLAAIGFLIASLISGNAMWFGGFICVLLLAFIADAIRCKSVHGAMYRFFQRALMVEGTIRGLFMRTHPPDGYPLTMRVSPARDRVMMETGMTGQPLS